MSAAVLGMQEESTGGWWMDGVTEEIHGSLHTDILTQPMEENRIN